MMLGALTLGRREQRGLACALIGEIAAAMEAVEHHSTARRLCTTEVAVAGAELDFSNLELPPLAVYEANVGKLSLFKGSVPRELSYFYTRLVSLPQRLRDLKPPPACSADELKARTQNAIGEIERTMTLGDDLLRTMKGLVSRRQPASISRA